MEKYKAYICGAFEESDSCVEVKNSYNGETIAGYFTANEEMVNRAIELSVKACEEFRHFPAWQRSESLLKIASELEARKTEFATIIALEAAKPLRYALAETERAIQTFLVAAEECKRFPGEVLQLDWTKQGGGKEGILKYFPVGLVAGISPFNFPLNLAVHKIAPAFAAGCPIVLKPASSTPLSTLKLAEIIQSTLFASGFAVLPSSRSTGSLLVRDERIKLLSFTGSPEVGWMMKSQAGKKKVVLELGGNAALIISSISDMDELIRKCLAGGFAYSGQVCIHTQRIFVRRKLYDDFCHAYIKGINALRYGHPLDSETDISSMIDEANAVRVEQWVNEALEGGSGLLAGGQRDKAVYQATLLTNTQKEMRVNRCEVFGPVVTVEPFDDFKEAVQRLNEGDFGLQAGVYTDSLREMNYAFQNIETGGIIINDQPSFRVDHMPYGGIKDSGLGREGVKYAMHDMLEPRLLVKPF